MPIFEYSCRACNTDFEELVLSPRETVVCPSCQGGEIERKLSLFSTSGGGREPGGSASGGCGCTPSTCGCH